MKMIRRVALSAAVLLSAAGALRAQEAPVTVVRASIASVDALNKIISDLGIQGIPPIKNMVESLPFLGDGSLDTTKPLGVVVLAANKQPIDPSAAVFAIPVTDGKATVASLTAGGAAALAGSADSVTMAGHVLRRSAGYLFGRDGATDAGLSTLTDDLFSTDYKKDSGNLAVLGIHLKEFRTSAPDAYKQAMSMPALMGMPADQIAQLTAQIDKIDRFTLAIATDDKAIHLRNWVSPSPFPAKAAKASPRPTFPAGTLLQVHFVFPDADTAGTMEAAITSTIDQNKDMPADLKAPAQALVKRVCKIVSGSDVFSFAVTVKEGNVPVVYMVSQMNQDYDAAAELKGAGDDIVAFAKQASPNMKITPTVSTYDAGGKTVQRLTLDAGMPMQVNIDMEQRDKNIYITLSPGADKMVGDLAALPPGPNSGLLCAGAIDLGAALNLASSNGVGPLASMKPDQLQELKSSVQNQGITWSVQISDSNFVFTDVSIPTAVVKQAIKLFTSMSGGM